MSACGLHASIEANMISSNTSETRHTREQTQQKIEMVVRFVVLAVPGFLIFMFCCLALITYLSYGEPFVMDPLLGVPLALASAFMILAGTGQWGRWAYLCVFLSIPIAALIWILLSKNLPDTPFDPLRTHPKLLGMLVFALPMVFSYAIVNRYYRHKTDRRSRGLPSAEHNYPGRSRT